MADLLDRRRIWQLADATPPLDPYFLAADKEDCCCAVRVKIGDLVVAVLGSLKTETAIGLVGVNWILPDVVAVLVAVFRNGVYQTRGVDFTLAGDTITFTIGLVATDRVNALYLPLAS